MKIWRNCAQTTLMNKILRHTDQGDVSSSDWLIRKGIRGIRLGRWNSHQSAFLLLSTIHPIMAGISSTRLSFMCQEPFQAQQVTCTDNRVHVGSAINSAEPYPTAYLVGAVEMRAMCCLLTTTSFSFLSVVGTERFFQGKRTLILSNVEDVGRTITSLNVSLKIASGVTCVEPLKNSGWSGKIIFMIPSFTIS